MGTVSKALLTLTLLWNLCALGQQPKPLLPDPKLTPGDVFDVTIQEICVPGYSKKVRAVPRALRKQAYATYGITSANEGGLSDRSPDSAFPRRFELHTKPLAAILPYNPLELSELRSSL